MNLKRFVVFHGAKYYPNGGWEDFLGSTDTRQEALELLLLSDDYDGYGWWQIVDTHTGRVEKSYSHGGGENEDLA